MSDIQIQFVRLIAAHADSSIALRSPLSEADEDKLAMELEPCDEVLVELLSLHDGQEQLAETTLFPGSYRLLNAKEIVDRYIGMFKYGEKDGLAQFLKRPPLPKFHDSRVREDRFWQTGWLPFAGEIEWVFIDRNPAEGGSDGQIVRWNRDDSFGDVVARDLSHFLELSIEMVESGNSKSRFKRLA